MATALFTRTLAYTAGEQEMAAQAIRQADHYTDQAFATAIRTVALRPKTLTGEARLADTRVNVLKHVVEEDKAQVDLLTAEANRHTAGDGNRGDDLAVAGAQLELDTDELADAQSSLSRMSGDVRNQLQEQLSAYESKSKRDAAETVSTKPDSWYPSGTTLASLFNDWRTLNEKAYVLHFASVDAQRTASVLRGEHDSLEAGRTAEASSLDPNKSNHAASAEVEDRIEQLKRLSVYSSILSIQDDRTETLQHLSVLYDRWNITVQLQKRAVLHVALKTGLLMLLVVGCGLLALELVDRVYGKGVSFDRRLATTRVAYSALIRVVSLVLLLLMVFGVPNQLATTLALAGAGLTVVLKDYLVAVFGWFSLTSRNGIRVGDSVEINGVCGDVMSLGLLRTVLLETGAGSDAEHPTGRIVTFSNSFAIDGHYFNFTTGGHWLWDELEFLLPAEVEPFALAEEVKTSVSAELPEMAAPSPLERAPLADAASVRLLSASPTVDVRPAAGAVNLAVRYATAIANRQALRAKVYKAVMSTISRHGLPSSGAVDNEGTGALTSTSPVPTV